jgi:dihydrofolate reductase
MIKMIMARGKDGTIGNDNSLPWKLGTDLSWFRKKTMNQTVVMGRKTFDSLPKGKLRGRHKIVMTRNKSFKPENDETQVCHDVNQILHLSNRIDLYIIGGAQIYNLFLPYVEHIYCTEVDAEINGDTRIEDPYKTHDFMKVWSDEFVKSDLDDYPIRFVEYSRLHPTTR